MSPLPDYQDESLSRSDVDTLPGATVLEFGASWCGYCIGAQPVITEALGGQANLRHLKIADGPGRPLGRSYRVKLWPTLIFLREGVEVARVVRPTASAPLREALEKIL